MMGKHAALLPTDRQYCKNHMWCQHQGDGVYRFGFSGYAVRLMQDVYFLEWSIDPGTIVRAKREIGFIESSKAQSELYSPLAGTILQFNQTLLSDPTPVNTATYTDGWLFDLKCEPTECFSPEAYHEHLNVAWAQAQRLLKNQINTDDADDGPDS